MIQSWLRSFLLPFGICLTILLGISAGIAVALRNHRQQAAQIIRKQDVSITFPEGWRREQMAELLEKKGITSAASFLSANEGKEGSLFPDTYRFFPNSDATSVVATLSSTFQLRTRDLQPTPSDIILASIIEREAANDSERTAIAGVYTNRLKIGMNLEADPTVQYAKDTNILTKKSPLPPGFSFWGTITRADYSTVISPFNTYLNNGLPPTPICSPGLPSIQAAMNPARHNYYYFVHRGGELRLGKTLAEHQANSNRP